MSGFTTTGSSILTAVEPLPKGILFWRSFTHWLGGMGVLVLTIALLPCLGGRTLHLMRAESPGPIVSKLVPRASQSSKILYGIYCAMTVVQMLLLRLTGMPWFDSLVNTFATAGTGGFAVKNTSIGAYGNPAAEIIITVFMLLFSVNFSVYFLLLCGKLRQALRSDELRFFLGVVAWPARAHRRQHLHHLLRQRGGRGAPRRLPGGLHHLHHRLRQRRTSTCGRSSPRRCWCCSCSSAPAPAPPAAASSAPGCCCCCGPSAGRSGRSSTPGR